MQVDLLENVGRYEIVGELGAGSMSRVYLAHDPNLDRKLALKIVLRGFSLDSREQSELERRFLLEARAAGKLTHPGIVRVYDADTDPETGIPYIAMEWVRGRSLRSLLEDQMRLSGPRTLDILAQVARALDYAHRAGRIHRDIKPSNILIATDGVAKVSDFGVAKIVSESHTISGQVLGTPAYMSPEQVRDDPLDGRSDLFSLGAVLYQCVAGSTPFGGDSLVQVVYKILNVDPRPLQLPTSPAWTRLSSVVDRALQKDPNARFHSGSEFARALEEVRDELTSEPVRDFLGRGEPSAEETSSHTLGVYAPEGDRGAVANGPGETRTVQLGTTEIHRAVGGAMASSARRPGAWDTVATPPPRRPFAALNAHRLRVAASLLLLMAIAIAVTLIQRAGPDRQPSTALGPEPPPAIRKAPPQRVIPERVVSGPPAATPTADLQDAAGIEAPADIDADSGAEAPAATEAASETADPVVPDSPPIEVSDPPLTVATRRAEPQPSRVLTPVTILYRHKGGPAFLTILLDGVRVWSQQLKAVEGRLQKLTGYGSRAVVSVPAGVHTLEVRLSDPDRDVNAVKAIRSRYTNGRKRILRVHIDSDDNEMQLRWKE